MFALQEEYKLLVEKATQVFEDVEKAQVQNVTLLVVEVAFM